MAKCIDGGAIFTDELVMNHLYKKVGLDKSRQIFVFWVAMALAQSCFGTSVLIIQAPGNVVYLAADSLQKSDPRSGLVRHYCKIRKLDDMYWTAATNFYLHRTTGFDLEALVASISKRGTLAQRMKRFVKAAVVPLEKEMASIEKEFPEEYARYATGKSTPLTIAFAGIENGD